MRSSSAVIAFLLLPLTLSAQEDEAKKRDAFAKEFKDAEASQGDVFRQVEARWEKALLRRVLDITQGNQLKASEMLGITRTTVKRKMDIHGL